MKKLTIDVWSDIVCPWCAIGKRRLETALASFPHKDDVQVIWHAFELNPSAARVEEGDNAARIAKKLGRTRAQAEALMHEVEKTAANDGLEFHLLTAKSGNTFDGHRVLHLAAARGKQGAVKERLLRGYMTEGEAIGEHEVLTRLASEAGLDADEVRAVLASDQYAAEVREDEEAAREMGIRGVPFFVLAGKLAVSGAQPVQMLSRALDQAWDAAPEVDEAAAGGQACGPDGCAT
jgi:predicted DsbA family dithiol-disulfide isomerase